MQILISNDDGIEAEGLRVLAREIASIEGVQVLVVAPDRERSASGHGISLHTPIEVRELPSFADTVRIYSATGTPADCVKLAVEGILGKAPDLVLSGINRGPNLGQDVFYSGTVSCALEGALLGSRSMAISVASKDNVDYTFASGFARELVLRFKNDTDRDRWPFLLNINIPMVPRDKIAGVAITRLGVQTYRDAFGKRIDPKGRCWFWLSGTPAVGDVEDDTDVCAVRRNLVSVTPLLKDLTDFSCIGRLGQWGGVFENALKSAL